jgi:transposase InsO family protein
LGEPVLFNTYQGAQFTGDTSTGALRARQILISMDGRRRALDNVFIERLWRTLKYEDIYLRDYADGRRDARAEAPNGGQASSPCAWSGGFGSCALHKRQHQLESWHGRADPRR